MTARPNTRQRIPGERTFDARRLSNALDVHERKATEHREKAAALRRALNGIRSSLEERLGIDLVGVDHDNGFLYDILEVIDVDPYIPGETAKHPRQRPWRWRGPLNNQGTPVVRTPRSVGSKELSMVRYIAVRLGVVPADFHGALYPPMLDPTDVNPWRRTARTWPKVANDG